MNVQNVSFLPFHSPPSLGDLLLRGPFPPAGTHMDRSLHQLPWLTCGNNLVLSQICQTPTMLGSSLLSWGTEIATPHARVCCFSSSLFVLPTNFAHKVSPHLCWVMFLLRSAPGTPQLCRMENACASTCWGACSPHSASCVYLMVGGVHC